MWRGGIEKSLEAWLSLHALTNTLKPKNDVAQKLLAKLAEVGRTIEPGCFGGHFYCVGVPVKDLPDAFLLGSQLGECFGGMGWEQIGPQRYIVFRDAHLSR